MNSPGICAVVTGGDIKAARNISPLVDLFEVRIDLIGDGWQEVVKHLDKPWLACNRVVREGGGWRGNDEERIKVLLQAVELGAHIVDVELGTDNLAEIIKLVKGKAQLLLSCHNLNETPPLDSLREIVTRQIESGADICKVVTTARMFEDNLTVLQLIEDFSQYRVVSFAMGEPGIASRILCPLVGGEFTYASIEEGRESAAGQLTVERLKKIYGMLKNEK